MDILQNPLLNLFLNIWLTMFGVSFFIAFFDKDKGRKHSFYIYFALVFIGTPIGVFLSGGALIYLMFHIAILYLLLPVAILFGVYSGNKFSDYVFKKTLGSAIKKDGLQNTHNKSIKRD